MTFDEKDFDEKLRERFTQLPKIVRDTITSANIEKRLRDLANTHKLHIDQWQVLENEVMLTLLGFSPAEELAQNIKSEVGISEERAQQLANDISKTVFEPIRQELERELEHPDAKVKEVSGVDTARQQTLAAEEGSKDERRGTEPQTEETEVPTPVQPTTSAEPSAPLQQSTQQTPPPTEPPAPKAVRMPASGAYKPGEPSAARKDIHDDPYREPPA